MCVVLKKLNEFEEARYVLVAVSFASHVQMQICCFSFACFCLFFILCSFFTFALFSYPFFVFPSVVLLSQQEEKLKANGRNRRQLL